MYKNIIGIIGTPRSGTSWLGQIFNSSPDVLYRMQPFYSWAFRDKLHVRSSRQEIEKFMFDLYQSKDSYLSQEERKKAGIYPVFRRKCENPDIMVYKEVMFHYMVPTLLEKLDNIKIIALVRHPIDVISSYYNAPREFSPTLDIQKEWYFAQSRNEMLPERYFGYFKWKEYVKLISMLSEIYGERVKVVRYEDLNSQPEDVVINLFEYAEIEYGQQSKQFLYDSRNKTVKEPYSVFRSASEKCEKKELPQNIKAAIKDSLKLFPEAHVYGYE